MAGRRMQEIKFYGSAIRQMDAPAKGNVWNGRLQAIRGFRLRIYWCLWILSATITVISCVIPQAADPHGVYSHLGSYCGTAPSSHAFVCGLKGIKFLTHVHRCLNKNQINSIIFPVGGSLSATGFMTCEFERLSNA